MKNIHSYCKIMNDHMIWWSGDTATTLKMLIINMLKVHKYIPVICCCTVATEFLFKKWINTWPNQMTEANCTDIVTYKTLNSFALADGETHLLQDGLLNHRIIHILIGPDFHFDGLLFSRIHNWMQNTYKYTNKPDN